MKSARNEKERTYSDWMKRFLFTETATIGNGTKRMKMRCDSSKRGLVHLYYPKANKY
ncbi:hypothetical protein A2U01_0031153, partial [Trifolium medium]|nr:hypothetical protein [Trifolium medium]